MDLKQEWWQQFIEVGGNDWKGAREGGEGTVHLVLGAAPQLRTPRILSQMLMFILANYIYSGLGCSFCILQIIMPCRSIPVPYTYFRSRFDSRRTPAAASTRIELTRNNHVGSLGLHFLSNCCLCFHANGNLGGDFPLDQPPLPRSSRPSQEKGGPLDNP